MHLHLLLLTLPAVITAQGLPSSQIGLYIDIDTGIKLYGAVLSNGYRFGMVMPSEPTTDFIMQLISPLQDGAGWGGVSLQGSMRGPLLLVTWANGDTVMTAPRVATGYTPSSVVPYTANPISLLPIPQGTFVNRTYVSSTFLCGGCINRDSFDPAWSSTRNVVFGLAYSRTAVRNPADVDTMLSDHTDERGGYAAFGVELEEAKSDEYEKYAAMARASSGSADGSTPSNTVVATSKPAATEEPGASSTSMEKPDWESGVGTPSESDFRHGRMAPLIAVALSLVGAMYLAQPFMTV